MTKAEEIDTRKYMKFVKQ